MKIGINVSFLRKRGAGIGEVTHHFLTELVRQVADGEIAPDVEFVLYGKEALVLPVLDAADESVRARFGVRTWLPPYTRDDLIRKVWWEAWSLPRAVKRDKCDVFLSLYQCPTVVSGVRHTMLVHDLVPRLFPAYVNNARKKLYQWLSERAITRADEVLAVSAYTAQDVMRELSVSTERVTTTLIDCDPIFHDETYRTSEKVGRLRQKYSLPERYVYFGGGLDVRKNAEGLLQAYAMLTAPSGAHNDLDDVPTLVISGKLMPELAPLITDVEQRVAELGIDGHVRVLGFVPQEELPALYAGAGLFVYPSTYEGFGLPLLEALACGTPAVASDASSLPEVGGDAVLYCNPTKPQDIAQKIADALGDDELRAELAGRGPAQAAKFSWARCVREVMDVVTGK